MIPYTTLAATIAKHSACPVVALERLKALKQVEPQHYPALFWGILSIAHPSLNLG